MADVNLSCFYPRPFHGTWERLHEFFEMYVVVVAFVMYGIDLQTVVLMLVNQRQITRFSDMYE